MSRQESEKIIDEARLLLPWYLTNTLSDEEQDLVNRALEASSELRKEFVREEKMMRLVKENTSLLELSALDTTEQRLENTLARIEREEHSAEVAAADNVLTEQLTAAETKTSWLSRLFNQKLFDIEWLTPANAAFASLLAVQVGVLGYYQLNSSNMTYEVAAVADSEQTSSEIVKQFVMEFQADAQHGEVCDFLTNWDAKIVSGPNHSNGFIVEVPTDPKADVNTLIDDMMEKSSANKGPVLFVVEKFQG